MSFPPLDPFERFAERSRLRLRAEWIPLAPRDVAAPLEDLEEHFLVTLSGGESEIGAVRLVFSTLATAPAAPGFRDVLWWLAGDAWAVDQAERTPTRWARACGLPPAHAVARRLFDCHVRERDGLLALLGPDHYHELLTLYDEQVSTRGAP